MRTETLRIYHKISSRGKHEYSNSFERAAPEAKSIFWDAIKKMKIDDAKKILSGRDDEATLYFKDKTYPRLQEIFEPIVKESMGEV